MTGPSALKRRKLNDASSKLLKPFVSPLRTRKPEAATPKPRNSNLALDAQPYLPSTAAHTLTSTASHAALRKELQKPELNAAHHSSPIRRQSSHQLRGSACDAAELAARKDIRALEQQIRHVQQDIDTLQQAHQLAQSSTGARLEALTEKWRCASQAVAEELFADVKERVDQMGGVAAWKLSEKRKYGYANGLGEAWWEETGLEQKRAVEEELDSPGEARSHGRLRDGEEMVDLARWEQRELANLPSRHDDSAPVEEEDEDQSFTMDMMLRSLNIELDVIGYDKELQQWI